MNMKKLAPIALLAAGLAAAAGAGTVTVDRVFADGIYVREVGLLPPSPAVLYYSFSTNSSTVLDESGNGYNGTKSGCVWTNTGPHGASMFFDGSNDYIDVGAAPNFPTSSTYSVSAWFLHNGGGDKGTGYGHKIIDKTYATSNHEWRVYVDPANGKLGFTGYESSQICQMNAGTNNYMDNVWHHAVVVRNGTNGQLWVDGNLRSTATNMISVSTSMHLYVGYSDSAYSSQRKCWSGLIDEVRIFYRALSSNEVVSLYASNTLGTNSAPAGVYVSTNLLVGGGLSVTGKVTFAQGVLYARPLGDLSCGIYTNAP